MESRDHLTDLLARYRAACPDIEPGAEFMPRLWQRIDARRSFARRLGVWSRGLATVAATLCLLIGAFILSPLSSINPVYLQTYVEALNHDNAPETLAYADIGDHMGEGEPQ